MESRSHVPASCWRRLWFRAFPLGFKEEFLEMLSLAWPAILTTFFQFFLQTTSLIMCGHLSKVDLDGVALASSFINVAGISIGLGMSTACDTLFSQTFGSSNKKRVGMYLQRSLLVMYSALLLLWCLHLNIRPVLLWLQQDAEISERAAQYMLYFLPGLFFDYSYLVLSRYLQNQNIMYPPMVAGFIGNVFNIVSQYIALHVVGLGYLSSAILQASSLALMFFITLAYIILSGVYEATWDGWKAESLHNWWDFIKLAVPGIFLIALEEWSFEVATIIAGTLGEVQLGAQSVIFQIETLSYMIPLGMSVAVNIRVGQMLGSKQPVAAAQAYRVGVVMVVMTALTMGCIFAGFKDLLPLIFSNDPEIIAVAASIIPVLAIFLLADGIAATASGAIRGCGRQLQGALLLFVGYYMLGLPVGIPLALLTDLKVMGMWLGLVVGIVCEAIAFCVLVLRLDWDEEVRIAQRRAFGHRRGDPDGTPDGASSGQENSPKLTEPDSEYRSLLHSGKCEIATYSGPEQVEVTTRPDAESKRRRQTSEDFSRIHATRRYSRSLSRVSDDTNGEDYVEEPATLPPLKKVARLRLLTLLLLLLALAGAVALRIYTDAVLPSPSRNETVGQETVLPPLVTTTAA